MIRQFTKNIIQFSFSKSSIFRLKSLSAQKVRYQPFIFSNNKFFCSTLPKHNVLSMPALSPTMSQGKIVKWNVKEGDLVDFGDVICQVQTDKATVGFQVQQKGYIAKISSNSTPISIGTPVVVIAKSKEGLDQFKNFSFTNTSTAATKQTVQTPQVKKQQPKKQSKPSSSSSYPKHTLLKMSAVSPTMAEGKILSWKIKQGDKFDIGDALFSIETDKAAVDYQATEKGYLAKIFAPNNIVLPVGQQVAVVVKNKDDVSKFQNFNSSQINNAASSNNNSQVSTPVQQNSHKETSIKSTSSGTGTRIFASPLAKTIAAEKGIDLSAIKGSGPQGRIIKQDLQSPPKKIQSVKQQKLTIKSQIKVQEKPQPAKKKKVQVFQNPFQQIQLSSMRKTIANRLTESKTTIPHYYVNSSVQMGKVLSLRQQLNKNEQGVKISVNDIIVKAVALALRDMPSVNSQWHGNVIKKFKYSDVCVAVATDGGLITPIIFRAQSLGLLEIAKKTKDLAKRARQGKLDPMQFIGGTTTVSNLGMYGVNSVTSVINPPQSTILGVGKTQKKIVFDETSSDPSKPYKVVQSMELIVSADHRVVDGAMAAQWLSKIKKFLEEPTTMLL